MNTIEKSILAIAISLAMLVIAPGSASAGCIGADSGTDFGCGDTVFESCTFNDTMTCSAGHGLIIGADGITIDGNGYTLDGVSSGACGDLGVQRSGIYNKAHDNVIIRNLEIKNFCNGIYLRFDEDAGDVVYNNTIDNCEVHHNGGDTGGYNSVHGIKAIGMFDSVIKNCKIHDNIGKGDSCEGGGNGIFLKGISSYGAWDNLITENEIYDNKKGGFFTKMMCKDTEVSYNKLWGNGQGGIILRCMKSENHTIEYNNASANYGSGIFIGGPNNTIRYNIASYNKNGSEYSGGGVGPGSGSPGKYGMGICMGRSDGSHNNEIYSNEVCGNEGVDIEVCPACGGNTGDENACNTSYNYDDAGATGCTYSCEPAGSAVTVINNCNFNANVPGGYYVLGGNLTCSGSEHGIIIGADGVVIDGYNETDGKYYWIDGVSPGAGAWSGIYNYNATLSYGYDNAVIKNLEVRNFYNGVMLAGSGSNPVVNNTIYNCEIHHNGDDSEGYSSHGIKMLDVSNSVVRNCKIYNNTGAGDGCEAGGNGFFVKGPAADYNLITNNSIYNNRKGGYFTKMMCDHTNISYNKVWGNGQGGIILRCIKSEYHIIEQNEVTENSGLGIYIGGPNNTIRYNTVTNTTDDSPYGLGRGVGIDIERSGVDNTLISNTVCGNDKRDIVVNEGLTGNTGYDNICDTTTGYNDTGAGVTECTYACPCEGYYITVCKSGGECNSTTIQGGLNKVCKNGIVYVEDGVSAVYNENTAVTKDNVTLNCNGATIKGAGAGIGVKILGKNGVIVKNCAVQNHSSGIYVGDGSSNCQLSYITAKFNANGFHLDGATGDQLQNNTVNGNANGFYLYNSDENQLQNNMANGNDKGFYLYRSDSNQFQSNLVNANADGFHLYRARYNQIYNNRVEDNTGYGINCSYDVVANKIYNNLFNNTENVTFGSAIGVNYWNTDRQEGDRIFSSGNEIGGNYWTNPAGNGYSDICVDGDKDGFCDVSYELASDNADDLPLSDEYSAPAEICGDVTGDEAINMGDVARLLYYVSYPGEYAISSEWAADVNCDESINMGDVARLLYNVSYPDEYELFCGAPPEIGCVAAHDGTVYKCGDMVVQSCTFNGNLECPAKMHGLTVGASDITIDGAGYKIMGSENADVCICDESNPEYGDCGIYNPGYDNVVIKNLEVENFCHGIVLKGSGPNPVVNNTIDSCKVHDNGNESTDCLNHGVYLAGFAQHCTVNNSIAYNNTGEVVGGCFTGGHGIKLYRTSNYNNITNNEVYRNSVAGIYSKLMCMYNYVAYNDVYENGKFVGGATNYFGGGIRLECVKTDFWTVEHNIVHDNLGPGIFVRGEDNVIRYNNESGSRNASDKASGAGAGVGDGMYFIGVRNNITANTFCDNAGVDVRDNIGNNSGDENTCDTTYNYDDEGTTGCSYPCTPLSLGISEGVNEQEINMEGVMTSGHDYTFPFLQKENLC